jgi:hypothetical protein
MGLAANSQCIERRPSLLVTPFSDVTEQMPDVPPPSASNSPYFLICNYCVFDSLLVDVFRITPEFSMVLQQGICQLYGSVTHSVCHRHPPFNQTEL